MSLAAMWMEQEGGKLREISQSQKHSTHTCTEGKCGRTGGWGLGLEAGGWELGAGEWWLGAAGEGVGWSAWIRGQRRGGRDRETPHSDYATGQGCLGLGLFPPSEPSSLEPLAIHKAQLGQRAWAGDVLWGRSGLWLAFVPGGSDRKERPGGGVP